MPAKRKRTPDEIVKEVQDRMSACKTEDYKHLNVNWLAREMGMHVSQLSRTFIYATGLNLSEYLHYWKMKWAEELLLCNREFSIGEIAQILDYTPSHFTKAFKKYSFGMTPRDIRNCNPWPTDYAVQLKKILENMQKNSDFLTN